MHLLPRIVAVALSLAGPIAWIAVPALALAQDAQPVVVTSVPLELSGGRPAIRVGPGVCSHESLAPRRRIDGHLGHRRHGHQHPPVGGRAAGPAGGG